MKTAIMQPYFFPYIGYFQLINAVDTFVIYDNIQYTKKGWINRNRFLQNGKDCLFSIPLKKNSDFLDVKDRIISADFNKIKLLNQFKNAYQKAPHFNGTFPFFEKIIMNEEDNLFNYIFYSIQEICKYLEINTNLVVSSTVDIDHSLTAEHKVIAICNKLDTSTYINAIGGQELYDKNDFKNNGIDLKFIKTNPIAYKQFDNDFVHSLSIIDIMMFNSKDEIKNMLKNYELI